MKRGVRACRYRGRREVCCQSMTAVIVIFPLARSSGEMKILPKCRSVCHRVGRTMPRDGGCRYGSTDSYRERRERCEGGCWMFTGGSKGPGFGSGIAYFSIQERSRSDSAFRLDSAFSPVTDVRSRSFHESDRLTGSTINIHVQPLCLPECRRDARS